MPSIEREDAAHRYAAQLESATFEVLGTSFQGLR
jgi:hypothetical protein